MKIKNQKHNHGSQKRWQPTPDHFSSLKENFWKSDFFDFSQVVRPKTTSLVENPLSDETDVLPSSFERKHTEKVFSGPTSKLMKKVGLFPQEVFFWTRSR